MDQNDSYMLYTYFVLLSLALEKNIRKIIHLSTTKNYYYHHRSWLIVDHHSYLMLLHFVTWLNNESSYITFMTIFLFVLFLRRPYTASLFMHAPLLPKHTEFQYNSNLLTYFYSDRSSDIFLINLFYYYYYLYISPYHSEIFCI